MRCDGMGCDGMEWNVMMVIAADHVMMSSARLHVLQLCLTVDPVDIRQFISTGAVECPTWLNQWATRWTE